MSFKKFITSLKNLTAVTKIIDNPTLYLNAVENVQPKSVPKPKSAQYVQPVHPKPDPIIINNKAPNPVKRYKYCTTIDNGLTRECIKFEEAFQIHSNVTIKQETYQKIAFPLKEKQKQTEQKLASQLTKLEQETVRLNQQLQQLRSKLTPNAATVYLPNDSKFLLLKLVKADLVSRLNFSDDKIDPEAGAKERVEDVRSDIKVTEKPTPELILVKKSDKMETVPDDVPSEPEPKELTKIRVKGYDEFVKVMEGLEKDKKRIIVFFTGDRDEKGISWCPTCNDAQKVIDQKINLLPKNRVLLIAEIGQPDLYYDRRNPFKMDKRCGIITVPVLMRWGTERRLTGYECVQPELVEMLFQVEAEENGPKS